MRLDGDAEALAASDSHVRRITTSIQMAEEKLENEKTCTSRFFYLHVHYNTRMCRQQSTKSTADRSVRVYSVHYTAVYSSTVSTGENTR